MREVTFPQLTDAERRRVEDNLGLVVFVLKRRRTPASRWDDEYQDGVLGLMRAAQKFEPERGFRFSTYAMAWIREGIQKGHARVKGVSYRSAVAAGRPYEDPLSLDVPLGTEAGVVLGDTLVSAEDPAELATRIVGGRQQAHEVVRQLRAACRDDADHRVVDALISGTPLQRIAPEVGLRPATLQNRRNQLVSRVRHPTGLATARRRRRANVAS